MEPCKSFHSVHCMHSVNRIIQYTVMFLPEADAVLNEAEKVPRDLAEGVDIEEEMRMRMVGLMK